MSEMWFRSEPEVRAPAAPLWGREQSAAGEEGRLGRDANLISPIGVTADRVA